MNKIRMIADRYIFNRLVFKILMVIAVMITAVPYFHTAYGGYVKYLLLYGFLIIGYELVTGKLTEPLKHKTNWLLLGFCASYTVTLLLNRESNLVAGVKSLAYIVAFFVLLYMFREDRDKESIIKEMRLVSGVIIACTFILSMASLATYAFSISGRYANYNGIYVYYGIFENRLWGVYNPNTGATLNSISILLSIVFVLTDKKKLVLVLNAINMFVQFSCLLLTGSRAAYYIMLLMLVGLTVFITVKKFAKLTWRSVGAAVVCAAVMVGAYVGGGNLLKEGYAYLPGFISTSIGEFHNIYGGENTEAEQTPSTEKQDFTRLEEVENREGGFFTGRVDMWVACLKTFKESAVFGVGSENLIERTLVHFEDDLWKEHFRTGGSHNIYISLLTSAGISGFLILGLFAVITLIKSALVYFKKCKGASFWLLASIALCLMFYITEFVEARILFQVSTFSVIFWLFNGYMYSLAKAEEKE